MITYTKWMFMNIVCSNTSSQYPLRHKLMKEMKGEKYAKAIPEQHREKHTPVNVIGKISDATSFFLKQAQSIRVPYYAILCIIWAMASFYKNIYIHILLFIIGALLFFSTTVFGYYLKSSILANEQIVKNGLPVDIIKPLKNIRGMKRNSKQYITKAMNESKLFFGAHLQQELVRKLHVFLTNKGGMLIQGPAGVGKTEIAKLAVGLAGGGYMVNIGSFAALGEYGVTILERIINMCINNKKCLILDDSEVIISDRNELIFKDTVTTKLNMESSMAESNNKSRKILVSLINMFLSASGSNALRFILTTNVNLGVSVDEAVLRRVLVYIALGNTQTPVDDIFTKYMNIYKIKVNNMNTKAVAEYIKPDITSFSGRQIRNLCLSLLHHKSQYNILTITDIKEKIQFSATNTFRPEETAMRVAHQRYEHIHNKNKEEF